MVNKLVFDPSVLRAGDLVEEVVRLRKGHLRQLEAGWSLVFDVVSPYGSVGATCDKLDEFPVCEDALYLLRGEMTDGGERPLQVSYLSKLAWAAKELRDQPAAHFGLLSKASRDVLLRTVEGIRVKEIQAFVNAVLVDPEISELFFQIPASRDSHHTGPGGLAEHSIECAQLVAQVEPLDDLERGAAAAAALFHDIGKVGQARDGVYHPATNHEARTLELVAGPLAVLQRQHADAAQLVRAALSASKLPAKESCPVCKTVAFADQLSALISTRNAASRKAEPWQKLIKANTKSGQSRLFYRPATQKVIEFPRPDVTRGATEKVEK